jgi:hypothetical protein
MTRERSNDRWIAMAAVVVTVAGVGRAVRAWQLRDQVALVWNDTADFVASSRSSWLGTDLWAGRRSPAAPVLLKLVGGGEQAYLGAQATLAALCWAALAASVWTAVPGRRARVVAVGLVAAFSVTTPVVMWESSVLSESLATSGLALVAAAVVQLARGVTWPRAAAVLAALALWLATRDSHAVAGVAGGLALVAVVATVALVARRGGRPAGPALRPLAAVGAGAVLLGGLAAWGAEHGERGDFPMVNVFEARVLPYPDRVRWFADHGMPQAGEFLGDDARAPHREPGQAPIVSISPDDPELGPWLAWVAADGRAAFARYVATHPLYLVTEPLATPERTFNNARGDRDLYAPPGLPTVPLVDGLLAPGTLTVLMVAAVVVGWAFGGGQVSPLLVAGAVIAGLAVPHGLFAWHSDGMETARHLVVPALQLHLGVLLMAVGAGELAWRPEPAPEAGLETGVRSGHA